ARWTRRRPCDQPNHRSVLRRQSRLPRQSRGRGDFCSRVAAGGIDSVSPTKTTAPTRVVKRGPLVYLVDDDEAIRDSLGLLLRSVGLECEVYVSALDFLGAYDPRRHSCLVADIRMPGLSGLELQQRLNEQRAEVPVIFITGHGD